MFKNEKPSIIIDNLRQDEKACFSRVGRPHPFDYTTSFGDAQLLQQYYLIILKAQQAIESSLDVINGVTIHNCQIEELKLSVQKLDLCLELEYISHRMQAHKRSIIILAQHSRGTNNLVLPTYFTARRSKAYLLISL